MKNPTLSLIGCAVFAFCTSCAKKPAPKPITDADLAEIIDASPKTQAHAESKPYPAKKTREWVTHFDLNSAEVKDTKAIQAALKRLKGRRAVVVGHACPLGSDQHNLELSKKRAEAVRRALVFDFGYSPDLVEVQFRGEYEPITQNPAEYEKNRRATISAKE